MATTFEIMRKGIKYEVSIDDDDEDLALIRWHVLLVRGVPYIARKIYMGKIDGKHKYETLLLHRVILERVLGRVLGRKDQVDHWDVNPLNNTRKNLRLATHAENQHNKGISRNSTTGYKGVSRTKEGRYRGTISMNGKQTHLGEFNTPEEAHTAYVTAAKKYHGEFARGK